MRKRAVGFMLSTSLLFLLGINQRALADTFNTSSDAYAGNYGSSCYQENHDGGSGYRSSGAIASVQCTTVADQLTQTATSSADLQPGDIFASASSEGYSYDQDSDAGSSIQDILHISLPDGMTSAVAVLTVPVTETVSADGWYWTNSSVAFELSWDDVTNGDVAGYSNLSRATVACSVSSTTQTCLKTLDTTLTDNIPIYDGEALRIFANGETTANSYTGSSASAVLDPTLSLSVPNGVTFTSESGTFLVPQPTGVPEPATFILLGTGLASLGAARKRKGKPRG